MAFYNISCCFFLVKYRMASCLQASTLKQLLTVCSHFWSDCVALIINITHLNFSGWEHKLHIINVNINIRKTLNVQAFHQSAEFCTKHTVGSLIKSSVLSNQKVEQNPQKETFERFQTENNDSKELRRHLYLSFLVWDIVKYSNREVGRDTTQPHEFKWAMPGMPMVLVFPAATNLYFPYGSLNSKWKSVCALLSLPASPLGTKAVKSQGNFWFLSTAHQGHLNTNQTAPTMPRCWQT